MNTLTLRNVIGAILGGNKMKKIETEDYVIQYLDDKETKEKVFNAVIEWCKKYELFSGESIAQTDDGNIEAPILMCDIVDDIIQFETEWK